MDRVEISLSKGMVAIIDRADLPLVDGKAWHAVESNGKFYAAHTDRISPKKCRRIYMHRLLTGAAPGVLIDHRNRNTLDNTRDNLRATTKSGNAANSKARAGKRLSQFRGVTKSSNRWVAQITVANQHRVIGRYNDEKQAAAAYDVAAKAAFGDFAVLNNVAVLLIAALLLLPATGWTQENGTGPPAAWPTRPMINLPKQTLTWFYNPDGSCVQCSGGMIGAYHTDFLQATLLFSTEYGRAERGGSGPDRVARYCRERGIEVYNVTGRGFADTKPWIDWSAKTGRFCAIGYFGMHFQTFYGKDFDKNLYYVQNNWSGTFDAPYEHSEATFKRNHEASGAWVVIPKRPPPSPDPVYVQWWK